MAAIAVVSIQLGSSAEVVKVQFGEAVSLGDAVYRDTTLANRWKKATNAAAGVAAGRDGLGISLTTTSADETDGYGVVWTSGAGKIDDMDAGAAQASDGITFIVGNTAGEIIRDTDIASGQVKTVLGVGGPEDATSNEFDEFTLEPIYTGYTVA